MKAVEAAYTYIEPYLQISKCSFYLIPRTSSARWDWRSI